MAARLTLAFALAAVVAFPVHAGDCIRNTNGYVVCGKGQCMMDPYGKAFCAREGGGAMREQYGTVVCGIGYCAADDTGRVRCSTRPGGGAAMNAYGKVQCAEECHDASPRFCEAAQ
jgi:hypothetical protein